MQTDGLTVLLQDVVNGVVDRHLALYEVLLQRQERRREAHVGPKGKEGKYDDPKTYDTPSSSNFMAVVGDSLL